MVAPVTEGTTTVTVTATDVRGSNTAAVQAFTVTVPLPAAPAAVDAAHAALV